MPDSSPVEVESCFVIDAELVVGSFRQSIGVARLFIVRQASGCEPVSLVCRHQLRKWVSFLRRAFAGLCENGQRWKMGTAPFHETRDETLVQGVAQSVFNLASLSRHCVRTLYPPFVLRNVVPGSDVGDVPHQGLDVAI